MSVNLDGLLKVDVSKLTDAILEGLQSGKMILSSSNGNVYWAAGSGNTGIVAQLPLIPVSPDEIASAEQLLQLGQAVTAAKGAAITATAVGTAVVVLAVIVATTYLANKIEKVERSVQLVAQTVAQQDQREYLRYLADYHGAIMSARDLLNSRAPQGELLTRIELRLDKLAELRHQHRQFIKGLPQLVSAEAKATEPQYRLAMGFIADVLDLMPAALTLERELCFRSDKPGLAQDLRDNSEREYLQDLEEFRSWCDKQYVALALGKDGYPDVLREYREPLDNLFNSPVRDVLLGRFTVDSTHPSANAEVAVDAAIEPELVMASHRKS